MTATQNAQQLTRLTTATPVQIDTLLAALMHEYPALDKAVDFALYRVHCATGDTYTECRRKAWKMSDTEAIARLSQRPSDPAYTAWQDATQAATLNRAECARLDAEYGRRGGWTRYYLADSHDGHVHYSTGCSTCHHGRTRTSFYWLTSESGRTAADVVADAKDQACTTCFSWAPTTGQRGRYRTPTQLEAEQRAAEKATKAAARLAKEITNPDGTPLHEVVQSGRNGGLRDGHQIRTAVAAKRAALEAAFDLKWYNADGTDHPETAAWKATIDRCVAALAARDGVPAAQIAAEIEAKSAAKYQRETR